MRPPDMMKKADIRKLVLDAIRELNRQLPPDRPLLASSDTILMGEGGILDSFDLVNLWVMIEEGIVGRFEKNAFHRDITDSILRGSAAKSNRSSPGRLHFFQSLEH
jgi:hypothetical protein